MPSAHRRPAALQHNRFRQHIPAIYAEKVVHIAITLQRGLPLTNLTTDNVAGFAGEETFLLLRDEAGFPLFFECTDFVFGGGKNERY